MVSKEMLALGKKSSVIREIFEYAKVRRAEIGAENVFDFSLGNPSIPAPPQVNDAIREILGDTDSLKVHGYTSAVGDLCARKAIALDLNERFGANCAPEDFFLCGGAAPALIAVLRALAVEGGEVLAIAPYFPEYKPFAESNGLVFRVVEPDVPEFQIRLEAVEAALTPNTQAIIINSPNNPSGVVYTEETLRSLAALLKKKAAEFGHPIYILSDEPYRELVYDGVVAPFVPNIYPNTIVCYSFSKALSIPGERLGYVLVPKEVTNSREIYAAVAGASRRMGHVNAPSLFQHVTSLCCDMTADLKVYEENCKLLVTSLREMGYHVAQPGGAFYLFPRSLEADDLAFSERAKQFDLLLVPGSGELMGGSQRETRLDKLTERMDTLGISKDSLDWYINLRKFGGCTHAGFGMGFERMIMYLTGIANIRDVLPFPRTVGNCEL